MSAAMWCACIGHLMQLTSVDMQSQCAGSFFTVGLLFYLCKHRNVIKTNRSGFLISFLFWFCAAQVRRTISSRALQTWMSFHFHYVCDLVHNKCIHAVRNTDFTRQRNRAPDNDESVLKTKVYESLFGLYRLIASLLWRLSLIFSLLVFSTRKIYYSKAFVYTRKSKRAFPYSRAKNLLELVD